MIGRVIFDPIKSESRMVWARWKDKYEQHQEWWKNIVEPSVSSALKSLSAYWI